MVQLSSKDQDIMLDMVKLVKELEHMKRMKINTNMATFSAQKSYKTMEGNRNNSTRRFV